ncbi:PadR family transcriptional regulator [uncultured Clostridium sp.]|uniref:PadR family transcriptional regulator n=1 Tax=uncultured Clostridium sp. TaxID=59620 RepID=UPI002603FB40|nr:PadR family transcriptional regulator [uncultured Clostridium sp.]
MDKRNRAIVPRNVVNAKMMYMLYILKELSKGNTVFGNRVLSDFKETFESSALPFPVSSSTVYESLYELEKCGYVVSTWTGDEVSNKRSKKIYHITDSGLLFLKNNLSDYVTNLDKTKATLDKIKLLLLK